MARNKGRRIQRRPLLHAFVPTAMPPDARASAARRDRGLGLRARCE
jgi:hypothetical protein